MAKKAAKAKIRAWVDPCKTCNKSLRKSMEKCPSCGTPNPQYVAKAVAKAGKKGKRRKQTKDGGSSGTLPFHKKPSEISEASRIVGNLLLTGRVTIDDIIKAGAPVDVGSG